VVGLDQRSFRHRARGYYLDREMLMSAATVVQVLQDLVLCFIACFIIRVIAHLVAVDSGVVGAETTLLATSRGLTERRSGF